MELLYPFNDSKGTFHIKTYARIFQIRRKKRMNLYVRSETTGEIMYRMWHYTVWQTDNASGTPAASLFRADAAMTAACSPEMYVPYT